ncbi:hypothetical protein IW147_006207 [Coemansia sp. RSA 720]|nr:hypothetical protein IW147_006207 [Coemansia sp. RSA 720]
MNSQILKPLRSNIWHIVRAMPRAADANVFACARRCNVHRRWVSDAPSKKEKSERLREWDRTVNEAIERAKREHNEKPSGSSGSQEPQEPSEPQEPQEPSEPQEPQEPSKSSDPKDDYIITLGRVMTELPSQIEGFFTHGLTPSLYTSTIKFSEPQHTGLALHGLHQYMSASRVLRAMMRMYFTSPRVTITRMRQNNTGSNVEVSVRWVFEGEARHAEYVGGSGSRYEGEFRYVMDGTGKIAVHEVTAVHPTPPTVALATSGLARWAGWLSPRGSLSYSRRCRKPGCCA